MRSRHRKSNKLKPRLLKLKELLKIKQTQLSLRSHNQLHSPKKLKKELTLLIPITKKSQKKKMLRK